MLKGVMEMMVRSVKYILVGVLLLVCTGLSALEFGVLNNAADMAKTKKITLRVDFSAGEKWVYKEMFRFSSDNQKIALKSWKPSVASTSEYITQFHQAKRVFTVPFDIDLVFEGPAGADDEVLVEQLERTAVTVSYVSLSDQNKHLAQTASIQLVARGVVDRVIGLSLSMTGTVPGGVRDVLPVRRHPCPSTELRINSSGDPSFQTSTIQADEEITYLMRSATFYKQVCDLAERICNFCAPIFIMLISFFVALLILMRLLMRSRPWLSRYYPASFSHLIFALLPIALIYLFVLIISSALAFVLLGGYLLVLGCYLVITQQEQPKTFKVKGLLLIGGIFIVMALPLALKGIVLFCS